MTAATTPPETPEKPRYRLDDALRRYLDGWAIGQERELSDGEVRGVWNGCRAPAAIALGYLRIVATKTVTHKAGRGQSFGTATHLVCRTDKKPSVRTFRPPRPGSIWPWSVPQHWDVIQRSACQVRRRMFLEMVGGELEDRWARYTEIDEQFPEVRSESGLKHLRSQFAYIIRWGAYDAYDLRRNWYDAGALSTPVGLARMLAAMMVRPVVQGGRITRFEPLDAEEQLKELARFPLKGLDRMLIEAYEDPPPAPPSKEE